MELQEIAQIFDCPHSTAPDEGEGYALIRTPNVGKGRLILDGVHRISKEAYLKRNKRATPQEGDIIFAREAPAGNAAVITKGQEVCLGQRTVLIRPNKELTDSVYLTYYILSPEQQIKLLGLTHGSTVGHVNIPDLAKLKCKLPSLPIQRKIASILSTYDSLIENNTKRIKLLEQMAENLYKEWFVRFRFPEHENVEIENGLPKGWKTLKLEEIIEENPKSKIQVSEASESKGQYPFFTSGKAVLTYDSYLVDGVNVMLNTGGIADVKLYIGKTHYSTDTWCLKGKQNLTFYLYLYLNHIQDEIQYSYFEGAALKHLKKKSFKRKQMLVPCEKTINAFNDIISNIFKMIFKLRRQSNYLTNQRDLLLPRLMSGKIEVKA